MAPPPPVPTAANPNAIARTRISCERPDADSVTAPTTPPIPRDDGELASGLVSLTLLADLHDERQEVDAQITLLVARLAAAGVSWGAIGRALGVSRQGARQRYG